MQLVPEAHIWARRLVQILLPSSCLTCPADVSIENGPVCPSCAACLERRPKETRTPSLDHCVSAGPFEGGLKELIHLFKYSGKDYLAPVLADFVVKQWPNAPFGLQALLPVPMPYWRELKRGYNQSHLLACELARRWHLPVLKNGLRRRWNRSQTRLSRPQRWQNAAQGFCAARQKRFVYEGVLLIDDVLTTGATLDTCARLLKESGVSRVSALTLAYD